MPTADAPQPRRPRSDMFSPTMQRIAASSGLLAALFFLVSFLTSGESPDFSAPAQEWAAYYSDDQDKIQLSALLISLAALELVWFASYLRGEHGRVEMAGRGFTRVSHAVLAGGVLAATGLIAGSAIDAGIASLPEGTDPEIYRALGNALGAIWMVAIVGLIVLLTASSLISLAARSLPAWTGWVGLLSGAAWFVLLFFVLDPNNDDSVLNAAWPIGFLTFLIWLVALSVTFLRRVGREPDVAARP